MHAVSINQIADILHYNDKYYYTFYYHVLIRILIRVQMFEKYDSSKRQ